MLRISDIPTLRCPLDFNPLTYAGDLIDDRLWQGELRCSAKHAPWSVVRGMPILYRAADVGRSDKIFQFVYDGFAPFHDWAVRRALPVLQRSSEADLRAHYMNLLQLGRRGPMKILEVGVGAGANLPLLGDKLGPAVKADIWGLDLSHGMMRQAIRKVSSGVGGRRVRFVQADVHRLPFADETFDVVFHVGAVNTFSDQRRALAELNRVARKSAPVVIVDEQLDPKDKNNLFYRLGFKFLTIYDPNPHAPTEFVPPDAYDVQVTQASRFFYALRWFKD